MTEEEIKPAMERIVKFRALKERESILQIDHHKLESISGNTSEDVPIHTLEFETCATQSKHPWRFSIENIEVTSFQIRQALLPLVKERLDAVRKEIEEL